MSEGIPEQYLSAQRLEMYLGDPADDSTAFSFKRVMEYDEREEFPEPLIAHVRATQFDDFLIPVEQGGTFDNFEASQARHRAVARRDCTTAIALGAAYLAFLPVWCGGSVAHKERFARLFRERKLAALALTERTHGADLVATETVATKTSEGWSITGEKWLINNASRGELVVVLAKTEVPGRRAGLSLFLVDKSKLDHASYEHLPKVKLHGTRGMDVCGIRLTGARVPDDALIGAPGVGLELVLRGFTCSRSAIAGRAVAATDTALRITVDFARSRRLYGGNVLAISHANHQLAFAFADLLLCDAIAIACARFMHVVPGQASLVSSISKYLVPTTCERILAECSVILGARFFLREAHWHGMFQKVKRDLQLFALFDGSSIINLSGIASQLGTLVAGRRDAKRDETAARLAATCALDKPLPKFEFDAVGTLTKGRNDIMAGITDLPAQIEAARGDHASGGTIDELVLLSRALLEENQRLEEHLHDGFRAGWATKQRSHQAIELARRYCILNGVALGLHIWVHSRHMLGGAFERGEWLVIAGNRMLTGLRRLDAPGDHIDIAAIGDDMLRLLATNRAFSIVPYQLAGQ